MVTSDNQTPQIDRNIENYSIKIGDDGEPYIPLDGFPDIKLTQWRISDIDDLIELYNQPSVSKYAVNRPIPFEKENAAFLYQEIPIHQIYLQQLINNLPNPPSLENYPKGEISPFGVIRLTSSPSSSSSSNRLNTQGKLIGTLHIRPSTYSPQNWEISYYIHPKYTSKGIGKETIKQGLNFMKWLNIKRIIAFTAKENIASNSVLLKNGFSLYSTHIIDWPEFLGGGKKDVCSWDKYLIPFKGKGPHIVEDPLAVYL
ncbi:uncharacterized protein I206_101283 [Kwoniella pini CBS 10737]|uniref:N-acetyltransferase domain-containing protein n=1 Tax=Kwoniella pini CBS 10737 TaxID=1296096 RepID=A0A1B9IBD0_9TREE|nr:uncharacterized protein I206_00040 [Kwoniella pini CBS 10737]OCF52744.1 hypothetical protein I206_00040 [Kwoniella pini CBS 10737]